MRDDTAEFTDEGGCSGPLDRKQALRRRLVEELPSLEVVARRWLKDREDRLDAVMEASLRCLRAIDEGVEIRSVAAFSRHAVRQEAMTLLRARRRRAGCEAVGPTGRHVGDEATQAEVTADLALPVDRRHVAGLRVSLPGTYRQWLDDLLSGRPCAEFAERDCVDEESIRKRWARLETLVKSEKFLERISDFPGPERGVAAPCSESQGRSGDQQS